MIFLFDIEPHPGHIRFTLELALLLNKKGHEVYYTDCSDSIFTSELLKKGIGRMLYPDDFQWVTPDLVLLDYQLRSKVAFYCQHGINFIFVAVQVWGDNQKDDEIIPIVYLPPSEYFIPPSSPRLGCLLEALSIRKEVPSQVVIAGLLEEGVDVQKLFPLYDAIKQSCAMNTHFQMLLLTNSKEAVKRLFPLPDNMSVYRLLDLSALLPYCDVVLVAGDLNAMIESVYAELPSLAYPVSSTSAHCNRITKHVEQGISLYGQLHRVTPEVFEQQIATVLSQRTEMKENAKQLRNSFKWQNRDMNSITEYLITLIQQKKK